MMPSRAIGALYEEPVARYAQGRGMSESDAATLARRVMDVVLEPAFVDAAARGQQRFRPLVFTVMSEFLAGRVPSDPRLVVVESRPPDAAFDRFWALTMLRRAIVRLHENPGPLHETLVFSVDDGMSCAEIALLRARPRDDVERDLREARWRVRESLRTAVAAYTSEPADELSALLEHV